MSKEKELEEIKTAVREFLTLLHYNPNQDHTEDIRLGLEKEMAIQKRLTELSGYKYHKE